METILEALHFIPRLRKGAPKRKYTQVLFSKTVNKNNVGKHRLKSLG
jgi:hypothetical protein